MTSPASHGPTPASTSDDHVPDGSRRLAQNPIAIVGMSALLPKAASVRQYWRNIVDGVDCTDEVPASRWSLDDYYDADPDARDKTYSRRGAFLPDVAFDPVEFGMPPNQLEVTSTMQTLSLGVARDVLADAGATDSAWYDPTRTGVVLGTTGPVPLMHPLAARLSTPVLKEAARSCGLSDTDADAIADKFVAAFAPWEENSFPGLLANVVAGRVANRLGLGGINCTVDAACAASLAAIRTAIAELQDGRADTMITGGVDTENSIFIYMCFSKVGALSKTGSIKPFAESADGTLLGEGITMLALRRLADAERDGNRIYAVIKGIGSSSDGRSKSIYAPRAEGQRIALDRAYRDAECCPSSVELFEAHATGTAVGDRTELTALGGLLTDATDDRRFAAVGSVKSQIGHTKGAAGTASVMKLALGLYHKVLPGTINVDRPNPAVTAESPYYVNTRTRPWIRDPHRPVRRAAASAMGFGGTNFHVVLEEATSSRAEVRATHDVARAYLWHAPDSATLVDTVRTQPPTTEIVPESHARVGFVAIGRDDAEYLREVAVEQLIAQDGRSSWRHPDGVYFRAQGRSDVRVAALFAGQGSQYVDMGSAAALSVPQVAEAFDRANAAFAHAPTRLAPVVFPPPAFSDAERADQEAVLRRTEFAQPAIGALAAGQYRFLHDLGLRPTGFCGHSFGELTALWASGAITESDFIRTARARGAAMASPDVEDPGTMLAIAADRAEVEEMLADHTDVWVCNHNAPDQVVVGGGTRAVESVEAAAAECGWTTRRLPVSGAFHTPYVGHAVERFEAAVQDVIISAPDGIVYADAPGAHYGDDPAANRATLIDQLLRPVEFVAALEKMSEDGFTVFVEFGPKQALTSLVGRTLGDDVVAVPTDAGPMGDGDVALKRAAVQLAVLGLPISDIDRYAADPETPREPGAMTVSLSAPEYVPPARRKAYRAALDDGYVIAGTAPVAGSTSPHPLDRNDLTEDQIAMSPAHPPDPQPAPPAAGIEHDSLLGGHIQNHRDYLEGQLAIARDLASALNRGTVDPATLNAVGAVSQHGVAISESHSRASEVLAELAALEAGAPAGAAAPRRAATGTVAAQIAVPAAPVVPAAVVPAGVAPAPAAPAVEARTPAASAAQPASAPPAPPEVPSPPTLNGAAPVATAAGAVSADEVRTALREVVADKTGYPVEMVDPTMDLEADLGVDSIKRVQVLGVVQERFPQMPALGPEQLGTVRSLDQIVELLLAGGGDVHPKADAAAAPLRHIRELIEIPSADRLLDAYSAAPSARIVVLGAGAGADALQSALAAQGWSVDAANVDIADTAPAGGAEDALEDAVSGPNPVDACILLVERPRDQAELSARLQAAILVAKHALPALQERAVHTGSRAAFLTVTAIDGGLGLSRDSASSDEGTDPVAAAIGGVGGLVKTAAAEFPGVFCRAVDVAPAAGDRDAAAAVVDELMDAALDVLEVGIDPMGGRRTVVPSRYALARPTTTPIADEPSPDVLTSDDVVLVTGGARGVTATCVEELAARSSARFVLLGRTALDDEPRWAVGVADDDLRAAAVAAGDGPATPAEIGRMCRTISAARGIRALVDRLDDGDGDRPRARYVSVDVADAAAVEAALRPLRAEITAVVHGAGVLADSLLPAKTQARIASVLDPKLTGLGNVLAALDADAAASPLHSMLLFTSVAGLYGNAGQADYATANEALVRFAAQWRRARPGRHAIAVDWGAWDGGMVDAALREHFLSRGVALLAPARGAAAFVEQYATARSDDGSVLIGVAAPLSSSAPPAPTGTIVRLLGRLAEHAALQAHRVGAGTVLPATFAIGAMVNAVERSRPGHVVRRVDDFHVLRGIVFDSPIDHVAVTLRDRVAGAVQVDMTTSGPDGAIVPRYRANLTVGESKEAPVEHVSPMRTWPGAGVDAADLYRRAIQFHGPALQGMRRILAESDEELVVECALDAVPVGIDGYRGALHHPILADLVLQVPPVLGYRLLGSACLPLAVGAWEYHAPLPVSEPFVVVVGHPRRAGAELTVDVSVIDRAGTLLQRLTDVSVVTTPDLSELFRESVKQWSE
ncbi:type I polyketide synthase [Tsukamurella sp. 8J]|uniref:type I polyketide synthase n=1 Tax=Tsukamurella sp. 8J TaxID=3031962 RepID=UPI0023B9115F|nr:type I polyketide synthase [Tsukamurella sp. 8J]MDF0529508.1 beta-ketoacyl synthase N-terminal-like domain-containing protein [Tsukamurella sp. 8J]